MKRFTQKQKQEVVQRYLESGMSCIEYCKQNGLHPNSLYRWKKQYRIQTSEAKTFVEIKPVLTPRKPACENGQNTYIEIMTKQANIKIPVTIGNEQLSYLFSLLGLSYVS